MALINRVSRLFKADFHAVLDQIEEPEMLLKQAIREMEDELAETEQRIRVCAHDQEALTTRKSEVDSKLSEIDDELDLCFASKKDDLAKGLIKNGMKVRFEWPPCLCKFYVNLNPQDLRKHVLFVRGVVPKMISIDSQGLNP